MDRYAVASLACYITGSLLFLAGSAILLYKELHR